MRCERVLQLVEQRRRCCSLLLSTLAAAMEETVEATAVADPVKETAVAETLKETAMAEGKDRLCRYARTLLLFAVYLCAGVFFYTNVETKPCGATPLYTLAPDLSLIHI